MPKKFEVYEKFKWMLFHKRIRLISSEDEYNRKTKIRVKCLVCGNEFETDFSEYQYVNCKCIERKKSDKLNEIIEWLKDLNIFLVENDNTLLLDDELDIFLPEYRVAIDFDDLYWHSELYTPRRYHLDKTNKCKNKNVQLLHIFENEWENKKNIVKSIILSKLGLYNRRFYARACKLKELSNEEYKEFVLNYHLQGYAPATYRIGLFHNDELLQICSIGKNRFKKDEMELVRHCSKEGVQIIGRF